MEDRVSRVPKWRPHSNQLSNEPASEAKSRSRAVGRCGVRSPLLQAKQREDLLGLFCPFGVVNDRQRLGRQWAPSDVRVHERLGLLGARYRLAFARQYKVGID